MNILENYLKIKRVQKGLNNKTCEKGFSLIELIIVIAVLAILSAIAIPAFAGVQKKAKSSSVKNGLVNGIKECVILQSDGRDIAPFSVVQSWPGNYAGYTVNTTTGETNNCYNAYATADAANANEANFSIKYNSDGTVVKWCEDGGFPGCTGNAGSAGTW